MRAESRDHGNWFVLAQGAIWWGMPQETFHRNSSNPVQLIICQHFDNSWTPATSCVHFRMDTENSNHQHSFFLPSPPPVFVDLVVHTHCAVEEILILGLPSREAHIPLAPKLKLFTVCVCVCVLIQSPNPEALTKFYPVIPERIKWLTLTKPQTSFHVQCLFHTPATQEWLSDAVNIKYILTAKSCNQNSTYLFKHTGVSR